MRAYVTLATIALAMVVHATPVEAFSLEPLSHTFGVRTEERIHTFRITNNQPQQVSVRVRVTTRDHDLAGNEVRGAADDHWVVFPRQLTLAPEGSQAVRVQYTGPGELERERAYRLVAEQLPVDFSGGDRSTGINVIFRFEGSLYVAPARAAADIVVTAVERWMVDQEFRGFMLRVENQGDAHGIVQRLSVRLRRLNESGEPIKEWVVPQEELSPFLGNNILAGRALSASVVASKEWEEGTYDVQYDVAVVP